MLSFGFNRMKRFLIIDANSLIHRAYHALPPLTSLKGEPTGAVYGFASMILKALNELRPDYVAAAFDLPWPTFRHEKFKEYKATRPPAPENLIAQIKRSKDILATLGITCLEAPGFEADDIIGTLAAASENNSEEIETIILSGDLDILQLASNKIKISMPKRGISDITYYDSRTVKERYGFGPELLADYKALRGDPSDNIPGVPGIGEKTASSLIQAFGSIENLYRELEAATENKPPLTNAVRKKLTEGKDKAFLSKNAAIINVSAPVSNNLADYIFNNAPKPNAQKLFKELGFKTLIARLKAV
jgi:DNA polymerase-1